MHNEQIFTPDRIIETMLDLVQYDIQHDIRHKFIIDNSCGNGNIIIEIVKRYLTKCLNDGVNIQDAVKECSQYVWGIEIDNTLVKDAVQRVYNTFDTFGYDKDKEPYPKVHILNDDALMHQLRKSLQGRFDFVIGNPPYCKIQHLGEQYDVVRSMSFTENGNTDLYIAFFEIGIEELNNNGRLCYITPNSWMTNKSGGKFREWLMENPNKLWGIVNYGHEKVFEDATTFTAITVIDNTKNTNEVWIKDQDNTDWSVHPLKRIMRDGRINIGRWNDVKKYYEIMEHQSENDIFDVKNGFATLNDKLFLCDNEDTKDNKDVIDVVKASTAHWHKMYFPYTKRGKEKKYEELDDRTKQKFTVDNYRYGRTQAINDVYKVQLAVKSIVKTVDDIQTEIASVGQGVFGGLYVISDDDRCLPMVEEFMKSDDFFRYVKICGHYKNGGYYAVTSHELKQFLNWMYNETIKENKL